MTRPKFYLARAAIAVDQARDNLAVAWDYLAGAEGGPAIAERDKIAEIRVSLEAISKALEEDHK